jgi:hypothetical protein
MAPLVRLVRGTIVIAMIATLGCSFSYSSKSISDSSTGSSASSSDSSTSSSPSDDEQADAKESSYRDDVRGYTAAWVRGGGDVASFQRGLATIARRHGITDWEATAATWSGVGAGLRAGDATPSTRAALVDGLAGDDRAKRDAIERGFAG